MKGAIAHIFNLDNLFLKMEPKVWVIDVRKPNKCLLKISKIEYDMIESNRYKGYGHVIKKNGKTIYLNEKLYQKFKDLEKDYIRFSFREFIDPLENNVKYEFDLSPLDYVDKLEGDIILTSTKGYTDNIGKLFEELKYLIKKRGYNISKIYHLNQSFFAQNTDENIQKIAYTIISNITGNIIKDNKIVEGSNEQYKEVLFYDSNFQTLEKLKIQLPLFMDFLESYNKELLNNVKLIQCNSNILKRFTHHRIFEKYNSPGLIKTFKKFRNNT